MSDEGFITSITRILLEDAGLSADGVPANSAGAGKVDGIGTGPRGEPGAAHRKRKRIAKMKDPRLFKALAAEDHVVELDLLSDAGQWRFDEGTKDGAIETEPTLPTSSDEIDPKPKGPKPKKMSLRRGPDAEIVLNPQLPNRNEAYEFRHARPTVKLDYLVKIGLGDSKFITFYRNALKDPSLCINNSTYRPVVARLLDELLDIVLGDQVLYNRLRTQLLQRQEREQSEEVDDDRKELLRFVR